MTRCATIKNKTDRNSKTLCKQRPVYTFSTAGATHHWMSFAVSELLVAPLVRNSPTSSCVWGWGRATRVTAACSWAEGRGTSGSGDEVMSVVLCSTLVSSAVFSGSRQARWRAPRVHPAQPESTRTQPRQLWSVCTVSCLRWSLQMTAAPLLSIGQVKHRWDAEQWGKPKIKHSRSLTKKGTDEENPQRHIDDRWGDVDKPVGKKGGYPQEDDVID